MTRPRRYLVRMGAFLLLALLVVIGLHVNRPGFAGGSTL